MDFSPESVDLATLCVDLKRRFADLPPRGYVLGRSEIRDAVVEMLSCSQLQAEELVDTMINLGYARFQGAPSTEVDDLQPWYFASDDSGPSVS
jgi:hypothetical protein